MVVWHKWIIFLFVIVCGVLLTVRVIAGQASECLKVGRYSDLDYWLFDLKSGRFAEAVPTPNPIPPYYVQPYSTASSDGKYLLQLEPERSDSQTLFKLTTRRIGGAGPGWTIQGGLPAAFEPSGQYSYDPDKVDFQWLPDNRHLIYQWREEPPSNKRYIALADLGRSTVAVREIPYVTNKATFNLDSHSVDGKYLAGVIHDRNDVWLLFWSAEDLQTVGERVKVREEACRPFSDFKQPLRRKILYCAAWSPQSHQVAYIAVNDDATRSLVVRDLMTGQRHTSVISDAKEISWTPDGQYILVVTDNKDKNSSNLPSSTFQLTIYEPDATVYDSIDRVLSFRLDADNWSMQRQRLFFYYATRQNDNDQLSAAVYEFKSRQRQAFKENVQIDYNGYFYLWDMGAEIFKGKYWLMMWQRDNTSYAGVVHIDTGETLFETPAKSIFHHVWSSTGAVTFEGNDSAIRWIPGDAKVHQFILPSPRYNKLRGQSHDEKWVIFSQEQGETSSYSSQANTIVLNLTTGKYRTFFDDTDVRLTDDVSNVISPDDQTIIQWTTHYYEQTREDQLILNWAELDSDWTRTVNAKGTVQSKYYPINGWAWAWSPDGSQAAFSYPINKERYGENDYVLDLYTNRGDLIKRYSDFTYADTLQWTDCSIN